MKNLFIARRLFSLVFLGVLSMHAITSAGVAHDRLLVYVGTYTGKGSEGIYLFQFDTATGELLSKGLAARTENPSFLVADSRGKFLYAVNENEAFGKTGTGAVSVFAIQPVSGRLNLRQQVSSLGPGPAHLSLDRAERFLMVANYGGGSVAVFPVLAGGRLGDYTAYIQAHGSSVNRLRQESPHAHCVQTTPDNRLVLVADLGIDKLLVYDFDHDTGLLTPDSARTRSLAPGAGPRHFAIAPGGGNVYVANELSSSVTHFSYNPSETMLEKQETVSTLPAEFAGTNSCAEIIVDPQGKNLYVSNRGDDSIVQFGIDHRSGKLRLVDRVSCGGKSPRSIALAPGGRWLLSANQNSNRITLFRVDPASGRLQATRHSMDVVSPVCVIFVLH
jgi:6-phosphogluconolactonase